MINKNLFFIFIFLIYSNLINANIDDNKLTYKLGKKFFFEKKYYKAHAMFSKIPGEMKTHNRLSEKSKLYMILIAKKLKKNIQARIEAKCFLKLHKHSRYSDQAKYIYAILNYAVPKLNKKSLLVFTAFKNDAKFRKKAIKLLQGINDEQHKEKVKFSLDKLLDEQNRHNMYLIKKLFKKRDYISALGRVNISQEYILESKCDYNIMFVKIKSCNELFLDEFSDRTLEHFKNQDLIK